MTRPWYALLAIALLMPTAALAASDGVFISEIAWAGSSASTADEWIELANDGDGPVDLSGWTLEGAGAFRLPEGAAIAPRSTYLIANYADDEARSTLAAAPDFVTTSVALSNSALRIILRDAASGTVDVAGDGGAPFAGTSGNAKASMERVTPRADGTLASSWRSAVEASGLDAGATELGTPGRHAFAEAPSSATDAAPIAETAAEAGPESAPTRTATAARICEAMPNPPSGEEEWVELCNPWSIGEMLDGWTLEDGSGASTALGGLMLPYGRVLVRAPKGKLNNAGDLIALKDRAGRVIDAVAYGAWPEGTYARVEAPGRGETIMRMELGETWSVTTRPTPGEANVMLAKTRTVAEEEEPAQAGAAVIRTDASPPPNPPKPATTTAPADARVATGAKEKPPAPTRATSAKPAVRKSRYKGEPMVGVIAVPTGVHAKTRAYVTAEGGLAELRFSEKPARAWTVGMRIAFVALRKTDDSGEFLQVNPNSVRVIGMAPSATPLVERWPDDPGTFTLRGTVDTQEGRVVRVLSGGTVGAVHLASAPAAPLATGDQVEVRGAVAPGDPPRLYADSATSLRLIASYRHVKGAPRSSRLPAGAAWGAVALAVGVGLFSYLRKGRIDRLRASGTAAFEELEG